MKWLERGIAVTIFCWSVREIYRALKELDLGEGDKS
jgi:hypothetical protein